MSAIEPTLASASEDRAEQKLTGGLLFLLAGLAALGALSTNIILPSFPSMGAALGVSSRELSVTLSSFFIAFAVGQLFVGPLSDRCGRKWLVLGGLLVFLAGCAVCALANDLSVLVLGRIIQALGVCAASVLSRAIARDLFDGEALARALALTMVAMAAAPGFSPLLGSALDLWLGWRAAFVIVGGLGIALALYYALGTGETHPVDRRSTVSGLATFQAYCRLLIDQRFILSAGAVSLVIGGLYAFFAAAPAILMGEFGLSSLQLGLFFASTVFIVFGAGLLAPRLAHRWGQRPVTIAGIVIAAAGGSGLIAATGASAFPLFTTSLVIFLLGMGLANPLGTAITLHPFGQQAGLASALLGFLQMACAALATTIATALDFGPTASIGIVLTGSSVLALLIFLPQTSRPTATVPAA